MTIGTKGAWNEGDAGEGKRAEKRTSLFCAEKRRRKGDVAHCFVRSLSPTQLVTVDLTLPTVNLTVPASTTSFAPVVTVQASDLVGIPPNATVTIDVDTDNEGDFTDSGETAYAGGTLSANGTATITVPVTATGTYKLRARVTDMAGNEGTSSIQTMLVTTVTNPW